MPRIRRAPFLLTGSNGVIGSEIARRLVDRGPPPLLHVHRHTKRIAWAQERAVFVRADLATVAGRARLAAAARESGPLAGIVLSASRFEATPLESSSLRTIAEIVRLDLEAQLVLVSALHPSIHPGGRILLFSDAGASLGWPSFPAYLAAKAGLEAATLSLARALGPEIIVSCLAPGSVNGASIPQPDLIEERTALGRMARPGEIAAAAVTILQLPPPVAQGQIFVVDGGRRLYP